MSRIRSIKPDAFTSESLSSVSVHARWTFAGLWTYADDEGRGRADVRLIKAALYPLDDFVNGDEINAHLTELESIGAICRYEANGRNYLHAPKFTRHQRVNRKTDSTIPECPRTTHGGLSEPSVSQQEPITEVVHREGKGREVEVEGNGTVALAQARDDVERICDHLASRIEGNGSKRPTVTQKWRDEARRLLDLDGRSEYQVMTAIDWCQADPFWRANVLSMPTLRDKYDQLRLAAQRTTSQTSGDDQMWDRALERAENREADQRDSA